MGSVPCSWWRRAVVGIAASLAAVAPAAAGVDASGTEPDPPAPSSPSTALLDNPFLPEDSRVNLSDCTNALPRPNCGSEERGEWRQSALFGVVAAGLAAIGVRLAIAVRRRDRPRDHPR